MRGLGTDHVISGPMRDLTKNCIQCTLNTQKSPFLPIRGEKSKQIFIELIMPPAGLPNKGLRKKLYVK